MLGNSFEMRELRPRFLYSVTRTYCRPALAYLIPDFKKSLEFKARPEVYGEPLKKMSAKNKIANAYSFTSKVKCQQDAPKFFFFFFF